MSNAKKTEVNSNSHDFDLIKNDLQINQRIISVLAAGVILISGMSLLNRKDYTDEIPTVNAQMASLVDITGNISALDDILKSDGNYTDNNLDWLDDLVKLSNRLHSFDLQKQSIGLDKYSIPYEFNTNVISKYADEFEELASNPDVTAGILNSEYMQYNNLTSILESCERAVNSSLNNNVYDILADYGEVLIKSKVLDACGLDYQDVERLKIGTKNNKNGNYSVYFFDKRANKERIIFIENTDEQPMNYLYNTLESINEWRDKARANEEPQEEYVGTRNQEISNGINMLKSLTLMDCKLKGGNKIVATTKMETLKTMIDMVEEAEHNGPIKSKRISE